MHTKYLFFGPFVVLVMLVATSSSCVDVYPELGWWERDGRRNFSAGTFERTCRLELSAELTVTVFEVDGHRCRDDVCEPGATTVAVHQSDAGLEEFDGIEGETVFLPTSGMTSEEAEARRETGVTQIVGVDELFADASACGVEVDVASTNGILPFLRFDKEVCSFDPSIAGCWPLEEVESSKPTWASEVNFP